MKLTQEMIDEIQRLMEHTKKDGSVNWVDGEDIEINLSAANVPARFISISSPSTQFILPSFLVCSMSLWISSIISCVNFMS